MPPTAREDLDILDPTALQAVVDGELRISPEQAMRLYHEMPLPELGRWADARCRVLHGDSIRTFVIDRNINYTNVCTAHCTFCAFRRDGHEDDAYVLEMDELLAKIQELVDVGGTQILMQGGMHPDLPLKWYLDMLSTIRGRFPGVHVHAFSPPEFIEFVRFFAPGSTFGSTLREKVRAIMRQMRDAGLDSIPGGGGEIFAPAVRTKIGPGKCDAEDWLTVMHVAHELGMNTSGTMMFGHLEGIADRVHHMELNRAWQDRAINDFSADGGGRYMAFISWPFQKEHTNLGKLREWGQGDGDDLNDPFPGDVVAQLDGGGDKSAHAEFGRRLRLSGGSDYLRTQALSRLYLDNFYTIGSSWVTMGPAIGQVGLRYGANDMSSIMMEENVVSAAGTTYCMGVPQICRIIRDAGFIPAQRNNAYNLLRVHDGPESPDLAIEDWSTVRESKLHVHTDDRDGGDGVKLSIGASGGE